MKQLECDVVVVAAGLSGLAAAISAAENGANVICLEKASNTGGAANMGMGPCAAGSPVQKASGISLTAGELFRRHMFYTHYQVDAKLVKAYYDKSGDTIAWLQDMGVQFHSVRPAFRAGERTRAYADGEYTLWGGGYNTYAGHNAYPAVYCIKITPQADSIYYFFYDYWKLYDPNDPGEQGGSGIVQSRNRAPETSYHTILWDWDNGDGTTTTYTRFYRCDEGKDYKASFAVVANKRMVRIDATLHFVSQDDYAAYLNALNGHVYNGYLASGIAMMQAPGAPIQQLEEEQTVTISNPDEEGRANVIFSGFTMPMFASPTGELTIPVTVTKNADGSTTYEASDVVVGIARGQMVMNYVAALTGKQDSDEATPVITLTLTQATVITAVFAETSAKANEVLDNHYTTLTGITAVRSSEPAAASYGLDGTMLTAPRKGVVIQRQADGTMRKVVMAR